MSARGGEVGTARRRVSRLADTRLTRSRSTVLCSTALTATYRHYVVSSRRIWRMASMSAAAPLLT